LSGRAPEADLEHEREQEWERADSDAEQRPGDDRDGKRRKPQQRQVEKRVRMASGVEPIAETGQDTGA